MDFHFYCVIQLPFKIISIECNAVRCCSVVIILYRFVHTHYCNWLVCLPSLYRFLRWWAFQISKQLDSDMSIMTKRNRANTYKTKWLSWCSICNRLACHLNHGYELCSFQIMIIILSLQKIESGSRNAKRTFLQEKYISDYVLSLNLKMQTRPDPLYFT